MSDKINHWKLGLLVVSSLALAIATVSWLGSRGLQRETQRLVCYFNESVQGLEIGSPVKMRGVMVGSVAQIGFASDRRHVEVQWNVFSDVLERLGLAEQGEVLSDRPTPQGLRVQLATTGITGAKFLLVDFFEAEEVELPFTPPANYVPTAPSTLKSMEDGVMTFLDGLPSMLKLFEELVASLTRTLDQADVGAVVGDLRGLVTRVEQAVDELEPEALRAEALALSEELRATSKSLRVVLDELGSEGSGAGGMLGSWMRLADSLEAAVTEAAAGDTSRALREAAGSYRGLADDATGVSTDLRAMLAEMNETLRALRSLASYLERDPGALLRGRASSAGPPGGVPR